MSRVRDSLAAPGGARLLGVLVALAGVLLLVIGVVALGGGGDQPSGAAPAPTTSASASPTPSTGTGVGSAPAPSTAAPSTAVPPPADPSTAAPSTAAPSTAAPGTGTSSGPVPDPTAAVRVPVTVLNNSVIRGLADRAATEAERRGWQVAQVGNFAGRLPTTTVYYTPGDAAQEAAARQFAADFPHVQQVLPRYEGLPPTPPGIVLVVTRDW